MLQASAKVVVGPVVYPLVVSLSLQASAKVVVGPIVYPFAMSLSHLGALIPNGSTEVLLKSLAQRKLLPGQMAEWLINRW